MVPSTDARQTFWILISGSKMPDAPQHEINRFREVAQAIGKVLAVQNLGLLGAAPHEERVLASQSARTGLHSVNPDAPFSTGTSAVDEFYYDDRITLVAQAKAAVFIGGGAGTLEEYDMCRAREHSPLIPVAAAGGAGATLAQRAIQFPTQFWRVPVDPQTVSILASTDSSPEQCAEAVRRILELSGVIAPA